MYIRSLGPLRSQTSRWRPFWPLGFILRVLRALRLRDTRRNSVWSFGELQLMRNTASGDVTQIFYHREIQNNPIIKVYFCKCIFQSVFLQSILGNIHVLSFGNLLFQLPQFASPGQQRPGNSCCFMISKHYLFQDLIFKYFYA